MLRFSEKTWRTWLNPSTNHNRYRLWEYRSAFESCFKHVELEILAGEVSEFLKVRTQIRPEFVSGNIDEDSATLIRIVAYN
jgi:hypothetical protein